MVLRCYSNIKEMVCLTFWPCRKIKDISWEEWHQYSDPLKIYVTDYSKLLIPFFNEIFPIFDPINGEIQEKFDVCWDNWIEKAEWQKIIGQLQGVKKIVKKEQIFYQVFIEWISTQLVNWDIIVVEGNQ